MRNTITLALTILLMSTGVFGAGGDMGVGTNPNTNGSAAYPYLIEDLLDFDIFAGDPNYWASGIHTKLACNPNLTGRTYTTAVIAPDTDNATDEFQGTQFSGVFDGNDNTISNLTITAVEGNDYLGLFGKTSGAEVKDLGVVNINITSGDYSEYIGGLCGMNIGTITQCYSTGNVSGGDNAENIGGLCGYGGAISNCYSMCNVSGGESSRYLGGISGYVQSSVSNSYFMGSVSGALNSLYLGGIFGCNGKFSTITNCYSMASVSAGGNIGGLGGKNRGTVTNCYSTSSVVGLCGRNDGTINNSFWDVETSGRLASDGGIGRSTAEMFDSQIYGFSGWAGGEWTIDNGNDYPRLAWEGSTGLAITQPAVTMAGSGTAEDKWIIDSLADFEQICKGTFFWDKHFILNTDIDMTGKVYKHALLGLDIDNRFTGSFDGAGHVISNLTINGGDNVGFFACTDSGMEISSLGLENVDVTGTGLRIGGLCATNSGLVKECYVTGNVTGGDESRYVGGLCGWNAEQINNCYAQVSVSGYNPVGGLCGRNLDTITNCYSTDTVSGTSDVGGFCGANDNIKAIYNCFWDVETSGVTVSDGALDKSTDEMFNYMLYSVNGWTGGEWVIDNGNDYPRLAWEGTTGDVITEPVIDLAGSGTAEDPWIIENLEDIELIRTGPLFLDKHFILNADIDMSGKVYRNGLIAYDVDSPFIGSFDGNGHFISNLTIDGDGYLGLFGCIGNGAEISNLGIIDVNITGTGSYIGSFCGKNEGTITNCYSTGNISGSNESEYIGGLCGYNVGLITNCYSNAACDDGYRYMGSLCGNNAGIINNCYSTGTVESAYDCYYRGGLCGMNSGTISNCYSTSIVAGDGFLGGLCGGNSGNVISCFWDIETSGVITSSGGLGKVTEDMFDSEVFGFSGWTGGDWVIDHGNDYPRLAWEGTAGEVITAPIITMAGSGSVQDPWVIEGPGDIEQICKSTFFWDKHFVLNSDIDLSGRIYIYGLIGFNNYHQFTGTFDGNGHIISNLTIDGRDYLGLFGCVGAGGAVSNLGLQNVDMIAWDATLGGLCGRNYGYITNCYSTGSVSGKAAIGGLCGKNDGTISYSYSIISANGNGLVGGLCGYNTQIINNCFANGSVISSPGFSEYIGGLCGSNSGSVTSCYASVNVDGVWVAGGLCGKNSAIISNCYSTGSVSGDEYLGGLCGFNSGGTIINSYSTGSVTGDDYLGGLCGYNQDGSISNCFWDVEASGFGIAGDDNYGAIAKTTADMQTQSTFSDAPASWDFADTWWINGGRDYPKLGFQPFGDLDNDSHVNLSDLAVMSAAWETSDGDANYNSVCELSGDTTVDIADMAVLAEMWLEGPLWYVGDINDDYRVDLADFAKLSAAWQATEGEANWDANCNLYADNVIDILDIAKLAEHWLEGTSP